MIPFSYKIPQFKTLRRISITDLVPHSKHTTFCLATQQGTYLQDFYYRSQLTFRRHFRRVYELRNVLSKSQLPVLRRKYINCVEHALIATPALPSLPPPPASCPATNFLVKRATFNISAVNFLLVLPNFIRVREENWKFMCMSILRFVCQSVSLSVCQSVSLKLIYTKKQYMLKCVAKISFANQFSPLQFLFNQSSNRKKKAFNGAGERMGWGARLQYVLQS